MKDPKEELWEKRKGSQRVEREKPRVCGVMKSQWFRREQETVKSCREDQENKECSTCTFSYKEVAMDTVCYPPVDTVCSS